MADGEEDWWKERRHDLYFLLGMFALIALLLYGGANWGWFESTSWYDRK